VLDYAVYGWVNTRVQTIKRFNSKPKWCIRRRRECGADACSSWIIGATQR